MENTDGGQDDGASAEEEVDNENVDNWVENYIENRDSVLSTLDKIDELRIRDPEGAREVARSFAESGKYEDSFLCVYFAILGLDRFFEDVKIAFDDRSEELIEEFSQISEDYATIENEMRVVYKEVYNGVNNPVTDQDSEVELLQGDDEIPLIQFTSYSGNKPILETTDRLERHLYHVASMLNYVTNSASGRFEVYESREDYLEELVKQTNHVERHLNELKEEIDELDTSGLGEIEDVHEE